MVAFTVGFFPGKNGQKFMINVWWGNFAVIHDLSRQFWGSIVVGVLDRSWGSSIDREYFPKIS